MHKILTGLETYHFEGTGTYDSTRTGKCIGWNWRLIQENNGQIIVLIIRPKY